VKEIRELLSEFYCQQIEFDIMKRKLQILIIDDEPEMLSGCEQIVSLLGAEPIPFSQSRKAIKFLEENEPDLIFCDLLMPDFDGMQMLEICQKLVPNSPVIIFSAYGTIDRAVAAMKLGAFDFLEKPFNIDAMKIIIEKGQKQRALLTERVHLLKLLEDKYRFDNIIGKSLAMREIFELIESISNSDVNILITGESGTGKELIARSIHARSKRHNNAFVPVNCGALPENLFEAELFGYEKGSFTGALHNKIGLLEYADGGTFFLDEVCELPLNLQTKLLRTLQDQKLRHVGGNELIQVNVRIISATNRNVQQLLQNESLRKDFYYRLNVINIDIPPLRERKEDIQLLAKHFLDIFLLNSSKEIIGFSDEVIEILENYSWPGNVRELENVIERAVTLARNNTIKPIDLPAHLQTKENSVADSSKSSLSEIKQKTIRDVEKNYLISILKKNSGNVTKAAAEAGLTRRHLYRLINTYQLNPSDWR